MEFTIKQSDLNKIIKNVMPAIGGITTLPVLTCIRIEALGDGITMSATDMVTTLKSVVAVPVKKPGAIAVSSKALADIAGLLPNVDVTLALVDNQRLQIRAGRSTLHLNVIPADQFPMIPAYEKMNYQSAKGFFELLDDVSFAAGTDATRFNLTGVFVKDGEAVAIDGHRMAIRAHQFSFPKKMLIPANSVNRIRKVFSPDEDMGVSVADSDVHFHQSNVMGTIRLIDGQFPDYMQVVPKGDAHKAAVKKQELLDSLKIVSVVIPQSDHQKTVVMNFEKGGLHMVAETPESGRAEDRIESMYEGPAMTVGMSGKYLREAVERLRGENVVFDLRDKLKPVLLTEEGYVHVIMPKRI